MNVDIVLTNLTSSKEAALVALSNDKVPPISYPCQPMQCAWAMGCFLLYRRYLHLESITLLGVCLTSQVICVTGHRVQQLLVSAAWLPLTVEAELDMFRKTALYRLPTPAVSGSDQIYHSMTRCVQDIDVTTRQKADQKVIVSIPTAACQVYEIDRAQFRNWIVTTFCQNCTTIL